MAMPEGKARLGDVLLVRTLVARKLAVVVSAIVGILAVVVVVVRSRAWLHQ